MRLTPSRPLVEKVRLGLFDEYAGEQRNVLTSLVEESLLTSHYDGEGRFRRNRRGKVSHFVYYEFGRRLGIARKTLSASPRL